MANESMNRFPGATPVFGYFGHHRSASNWISGIVNVCCQQLGLRYARVHSPAQFERDIKWYIERHNLNFLAYINARFRFVREIPELRGFHVVRDPRDVLVSAYYSHRYTHPTDEWPELVRHKKQLELCSEEEGLLLEMEILRGVFHNMNSWEYDHENILELRFESMVEDPLDAFSGIFRHLGLLHALGPENLERVVLSNCFERLSRGRSRGETDLRSHYRSGQVGDWRRHFTPDLTLRFWEKHGSLLKKLGYE